MQFEVVTQRVQPVCKGDHRGDADAATHQECLGGALVQFEMVDGFGDKDPPVFGEDPVQHLLATPALILTQDPNLVF